jgi:hypothetical protein
MNDNSSRFSFAPQSAGVDTPTDGFEFVCIEDVSNDFGSNNVHELTLRQRMYGDEWELRILSSPEWDNVIINGGRAFSERQYQEQALAAFCYLSVILK